VAGLDSDLQTPTLAQARLDGALAVVVGSEGEGLSRLTREKCDFLVRLPMHGASTASTRRWRAASCSTPRARRAPCAPNRDAVRTMNVTFLDAKPSTLEPQTGATGVSSAPASIRLLFPYHFLYVTLPRSAASWLSSKTGQRPSASASSSRAG
jgi:hypothetical protein